MLNLISKPAAVLILIVLTGAVMLGLSLGNTELFQPFTAQAHSETIRQQNATQAEIARAQAEALKQQTVRQSKVAEAEAEAAIEMAREQTALAASRTQLVQVSILLKASAEAEQQRLLGQAQLEQLKSEAAFREAQHQEELQAQQAHHQWQQALAASLGNILMLVLLILAGGACLMILMALARRLIRSIARPQPAIVAIRPVNLEGWLDLDYRTWRIRQAREREQVERAAQVMGGRVWRVAPREIEEVRGD